MPRVYVVQQARLSKHRRVCVTCGAEVQRFETYRYAEPRTGPRLVWCYRHMPKRSQLSASKLGAVWDAIDDFDSGTYTNVEDLQAAIEEIKSIATQVQEEYEDSLQNMVTTEGPIPEAMQQNIDFLEAYAADLENLDYSEAKTDEDVREEVEFMVAREMLDEERIDYSDGQLMDADLRGELITEHLDASVFEAQVNERCEEVINASLVEVLLAAQEVVESLEG
jgi:hypothetical protein